MYDSFFNVGTGDVHWVRGGPEILTFGCVYAALRRIRVVSYLFTVGVTQ